MMKGLWMTLKRVLRCNPYNKSNPYDPVPQKQNVPSSFIENSLSESLKVTSTFSTSSQPANSSHPQKLKRARHA